MQCPPTEYFDDSDENTMTSYLYPRYNGEADAKAHIWKKKNNRKKGRLAENRNRVKGKRNRVRSTPEQKNRRKTVQVCKSQ